MNTKRSANSDLVKQGDLEVIYIAGGCLWGVQEFAKHIPGVEHTQAGRANGSSHTTDAPYDGYAECVKITFNPNAVSVDSLMDYFFEIIDPYSLNKQGDDVGEKYRTGVYSEHAHHLDTVRKYIAARDDSDDIVVEVLPLLNYVKSDDEHQDRLTRFPQDYCHIPQALLHKYKPQ
ncbi:peptide-methionine (S)-S-oxide reductase [Thalassotalea ponticola]|uniref:peptide-methionine (S)-S-oxide reductase n=1 Tax=Thalassotalea ponticola TaxID=1523392 RepID=UPI0025B4451E|nr:peptide-methionine (S)-S-oxide reductase [Thalassotalea ponticola]MDN3652358.1 peptide-methionine (S)-S-oxide reductase [Thalassotalea ponticola]